MIASPPPPPFHHQVPFMDSFSWFEEVVQAFSNETSKLHELKNITVLYNEQKSSDSKEDNMVGNPSLFTNRSVSVQSLHLKLIWKIKLRIQCNSVIPFILFFSIRYNTIQQRNSGKNNLTENEDSNGMRSTGWPRNPTLRSPVRQIHINVKVRPLFLQQHTILIELSSPENWALDITQDKWSGEKSIKIPSGGKHWHHDTV